MVSASYRPTEAKYKGGARQMHVTYDLPQKTPAGTTATYPKVKRVYISGDVKDWKVGTFPKKTGRVVHGVRIEYAQTRGGYRRKGFTATRGHRKYEVGPAEVKPTSQTFAQVIELPTEARNVQFHMGELPERYGAALQDVQ